VSEHFANWDDRTLDLAVDYATTGLDEADQRSLRSNTVASDLEQFEYAVAALHLSGLAELQAPSAELMRRLENSASRHFGTQPATTAREGGPSFRAPRSGMAPILPPLLTIGGWLAAAVLVLAFVLRGSEGDADPVTRRSELVASATDLVRIPWSATPDPLADGVSGDVVWSRERQEGYMRFRNLAANNPARNQYQLWIFDSSRADWELEPVDGGVFDVGPGEEVIVPIDPKLAVRDAAMFAVTLEAPGGVVVSKRERLVLTAAL